MKISGMNLKMYRCANRYDAPFGNTSKCGGRVRTRGALCRECETQIFLAHQLRRDSAYRKEGSVNDTGDKDTH